MEENLCLPHSVQVCLSLPVKSIIFYSTHSLITPFTLQVYFYTVLCLFSRFPPNPEILQFVFVTFAMSKDTNATSLFAQQSKALHRRHKNALKHLRDNKMENNIKYNLKKDAISSNMSTSCTLYYCYLSVTFNQLFR